MKGMASANSNQFSAMVDFAYNAGCGGLTSTWSGSVVSRDADGAPRCRVMRCLPLNPSDAIELDLHRLRVTGRALLRSFLAHTPSELVDRGTGCEKGEASALASAGSDLVPAKLTNRLPSHSGGLAGLVRRRKAEAALILKPTTVKSGC